MDQSKCHVPDYKSDGVYADPFDQMIVGVKVCFYHFVIISQVYKLRASFHFLDTRRRSEVI